jgi:hypothetical protein
MLAPFVVSRRSYFMHVYLALNGGPFLFDCSGKTSILFHYAYSVASEGKTVVFICKRAKLDLGAPVLPRGVNATDAAFNNVKMRYVRRDHGS